MNLETFFEKFDLFADCPNAVQKMRELILELAVQGKLVLQDKREGSGQVALERARSERENIPKKLNSTSIRGNCSESFFDIPGSWAWTTLGDFADYGRQTKVESSIEVTAGTWVLDLEDIEKGSSRLIARVRVEERPFQSAKTVFRKGDVLFGKLRPYLNKIVIASEDGLCTTEIVPIVLYGGVYPDFLVIYLKSPYVMRRVSELMYGMKMPRLSTQDAVALPVPIPPLAEQKRIVAKVDELMALCDTLEAQQKERETKRVQLAKASLAAFADAPSPTSLERLFHPSFAIDPADLRKSILTLAVQGKLVPQVLGDGGVDSLLHALSILRKIENAKDYPPVTADEWFFEIPESWCWTRMGNISLRSDSGWSPQCHSEARAGNAWGVLKVSAVSWGVFDPDANKALPSGMEIREECEVRDGDFLLSRANTEELVARSVVVYQTPPHLMMSDKIVRFQFSEDISKGFINLVNSSDPAREYYARNASGTSSSMKNVGREVMCKLPVPLPPLAEQQRIVAKVDELMALVDSLEAKIVASREAASRLLEAMVAELSGKGA